MKDDIRLLRNLLRQKAECPTSPLVRQKLFEHKIFCLKQYGVNAVRDAEVEAAR